MALTAACVQRTVDSPRMRDIELALWPIKGVYGWQQRSDMQCCVTCVPAKDCLATVPLRGHTGSFTVFSWDQRRDCRGQDIDNQLGRSRRFSLAYLETEIPRQAHLFNHTVYIAPVIYRGDILLGDTLERGHTRRLQAAVTISEGGSLVRFC